MIEKYLPLIICLITFWVSVPHAGFSAAGPDEILVVANKRMSGAVDIARYYMEKREIPESHLLVTSLSLTEVMERKEFNDRLKEPVRKKIQQLSKTSQIYGIVLIYGVPLKVLPPELDWDSEEMLQKLKREKVHLQKEKGKKQTDTSRIKELGDKINSIAGRNKRAAVGSELMLVMAEDYPLDNWIANPYFVGFKGKDGLLAKDDVLIVSRLDGPNKKTVYRLIDDAIEAEKNGLAGTAYFDARWPIPKSTKKLSGYAQWDASLHKAADIVKKRMDVKLDSKASLFPENSAPNAALYSGWYSLAKYVDSFDWVKGAVGYHIASAECSTLRKKDSQVWCLQMLKRGVAATIGPVYEPYVQGFPLPEVFFSALTEGYMNLGESYLISLPYISWQMELIGDPLYQPFSPQ